jgi:hypothetical protein
MKVRIAKPYQQIAVNMKPQVLQCVCLRLLYQESSACESLSSGPVPGVMEQGYNSLLKDV